MENLSNRPQEILGGEPTNSVEKEKKMLKYKIEIDPRINQGYKIRCALLYLKEGAYFFLAIDSDSHLRMIEDRLGAGLYVLEKRGEVIPLGGGFIKKTTIGVIEISGRSSGLAEYYDEHEGLMEMYPSINGLEGCCSGGMPTSILKEIAPEILRQTGAKELDLSSLEERDEMMVKKIGDRKNK